MSDMRVLVTGSTGCIGNHAVRILLGRRGGGIWIQPFGSGGSAFRKLYWHRTGDLSNPESVAQVVREVQPTRVLHLGALQTPDCRDYPMRGLEVNLLGTAYLFKPAKNWKDPWTALSLLVRVP